MATPLLERALRKLIHGHPRLERLVLYRNPREYWRKRGGERYFEEQEAVDNRTLRSQFIAEEVCRLSFTSVLEIGCGYGKQLKNFLPTGALIVGCDFSHPQLLKARPYAVGANLHWVEADGAALPFQDKSFDVVLSSAVILHNQFLPAKHILAEMIRVSRRYLVYNEDTDVTFSRYGYDMKKTYEKMNFKILESKPIPAAPDPAITQFTVVELPAAKRLCGAEDIPLQYH